MSDTRLEEIKQRRNLEKQFLKNVGYGKAVEDVDFLLQELKKLQQENEKLKLLQDLSIDHTNNFAAIQKAAGKLEAENERYKEAWIMAKPIVEHNSPTLLEMIEETLKAGNE